MDGTYILITSQTFLLQIKGYTQMKSNNLSRLYQHLPSYPKEHPLRVQFLEWLKSTGGGGRTASQAEQDVSRAFKVLRYCCENFSDVEEQDINMRTIDYCSGSSVILAYFMDAAERVWNLGFSSKINYLNALQDLIDFRKFSGASSNIVHNFSVSETFSKEHGNFYENRGIYSGQMILTLTI